MPLSPNNEERVKKVIKYILISGIGAAAVVNVRKGGIEGFLHFRETKMERFFLGVVKQGRKRINQITGELSDFKAASEGRDFDVKYDDHVESSDEDIEEIEAVFIDERGDTPYNER